MRSTPLLIEATPVDAYVVHVRFEDGVAADVDLAYLLDYDGVLSPLRDPDYFPEPPCRPRGRNDRLAQRGRHRT